MLQHAQHVSAPSLRAGNGSNCVVAAHRAFISVVEAWASLGNFECARSSSHLSRWFRWQASQPRHSPTAAVGVITRAMAGTLAHPGIGAVRESMTGGTMARPALASMKGADRTATDMAGSSVLDVCALRPAATAVPVQARSTRPADVTSAASDRSVVPSVFKPGGGTYVLALRPRASSARAEGLGDAPC
jgi:hypothetical protein